MTRDHGKPRFKPPFDLIELGMAEPADGYLYEDLSGAGFRDRQIFQMQRPSFNLRCFPEHHSLHWLLSLAVPFSVIAS